MPVNRSPLLRCLATSAGPRVASSGEKKSSTHANVGCYVAQRFEFCVEVVRAAGFVRSTLKALRSTPSFPWNKKQAPIIACTYRATNMCSCGVHSFCVCSCVTGEPGRATGGDGHPGAVRTPVRLLQLRPGARGDSCVDEAGSFLPDPPSGAGTWMHACLHDEQAHVRA